MAAIRSVARTALAAAAITAAAPASAVDYSVNVIRYIDPATGTPAAFTQLWANNNNGKVVGIASMSGDPAATFPFVYDPAVGAFSPLPPPPLGVPTDYGVVGINDVDAISGPYFDGTIERGYIERGGVYSYFSYPGLPNTQGGRTISNPTAAHPQGLVVGFAYDDAAVDPLAGYRGFVYDPVTTNFFTIPVPPSTITIAQGLNIAGQVVGGYHPPGPPGGPQGYRGFLYTPTTSGEPLLGGTVATFQIAGFGTRARGINDHGLLAAAVNDVPGTGITHAYVGTATGPTPGYQRIEMPGVTGGPCADGSWPTAFPEGLNNSGQVTGIYVDSTCATSGFIATPAYVPNGTTPAGAYTFTVDVVPDVPVFLDPAVAIAYDYEIGKKDPRFASVRLPLGIGNNQFVLVVGGKAYDLPAGRLFDFTEHGYKKGVKAFRVACIDPAALLDPVNSLAFPTEVTFMEAGRFTGTQMPLTALRDHGGIDLSTTQAQCREKLLKAERVNGPAAD